MLRTPRYIPIQRLLRTAQNRTIATAFPSSTFVAPSPPLKAELKDEANAKHSQIHPADLRKVVTAPMVHKSTRPHEDWVLHHPVYTPEEVNAIQVVRHPRVDMSDKVASAMVAFARWGFDFVTRYKHASPEAALAKLKAEGKESLSVQEMRDQGWILSCDDWLRRILFLESIAGVPGMVGAMARHLQSLRLMRRDGGFINTLLQEAENERMHLMTFMKIKQPSKFFRFCVLGAQGIFFNLFFAAYLISPKAAHRFVGFLEEEACVTYTQIANEIRLGHIPEWTPGRQVVPQIAKDYWRMPENATMLDLILQVRADESGHRFLNHTIANLKAGDSNPFGVRHASKLIEGTSPGFTREESLAWAKAVEEELREGREVVEAIKAGEEVKA